VFQSFEVIHYVPDYYGILDLPNQEFQLPKSAKILSLIAIKDLGSTQVVTTFFLD
jgi:hypothetical protein